MKEKIVSILLCALMFGGVATIPFIKNASNNPDKGTSTGTDTSTKQTIYQNLLACSSISEMHEMLTSSENEALVSSLSMAEYTALISKVNRLAGSTEDEQTKKEEMLTKLEAYKVVASGQVQGAADTDPESIPGSNLGRYFARDTDMAGALKRNVSYSFNEKENAFEMKANAGGEFGGLLWLYQYYYSPYNLKDVNTWHSNMVITLRVDGPISTAPTVMKITSDALDKKFEQEIPVSVTKKYIRMNIDLTGWNDNDASTGWAGYLSGIDFSFLNGTSAENRVYIREIIFCDSGDSALQMSELKSNVTQITGRDLANWGGAPSENKTGTHTSAVGLEGGSATFTFDGSDAYAYYLPRSNNGANIKLGKTRDSYSQIAIKYKYDLPNDFVYTQASAGFEIFEELNIFVVGSSGINYESGTNTIQCKGTLPKDEDWHIAIINLETELGTWESVKSSSLVRLRIDPPESKSRTSWGYGSQCKMYIDSIVFMAFDESIADYSHAFIEHSYAYGIDYNVDSNITREYASDYFFEESTKQVAIKSEQPTKLAYEFANWKDEAQNTYVAGDTISITGTEGEITIKTLTAQWKAKEYNITYDLNGGSIEAGEYSNAYTIESGIMLPKVTNPHKSFKGWTVTKILSSESSYSVGDFITENVGAGAYGDLVLTAEWEAMPFTLIYNANGGKLSNGKETDSITYTIDSTIQLPTPTRSHYTFVGWKVTKVDSGASWTKNAVLTQGSYEDQHGNVTLTAEWKAVDYRLTFTAGEGVLDTDGLNYDDHNDEYYLTYNVDAGKVTSLPTATAEYKDFVGWKVTSAEDATHIQGQTISLEDIEAILRGEKILYGNMTFEAVFGSTKMFTYLVVDQFGGTISTGEGDSLQEGYSLIGYVENRVPTKVKPTAKAGYKFVGWFLDEDCKNAVDSTWVAEDGTITPGTVNGAYVKDSVYYAKFEALFVKLTISVTDVEDKNATFIYTIKGTPTLEGYSEVNVKVVVKAGSSATVLLPAGEYTVAEDGNWSWRYEAKDESDNSQVVTVNGNSNEIISIAVEQELKDSKWLSGTDSHGSQG